MVSFGHLIAVLAVAVSAASIAIAVYQYRRTVHRDIFRVYADKYDAILQPEIYPQWQKALAGDNTHWERLTPVMIAYLNLIWEECYLAGDRVSTFNVRPRSQEAARASATLRRIRNAWSSRDVSKIIWTVSRIPTR